MSSRGNSASYSNNLFFKVGTISISLCLMSGTALAQAACFAAKQYHASVVDISEAFFAEYPMSSSCAVVMGSTALELFSHRTKEFEDELGSALTAICGLYCVFGSEAACGYASKALLQYGLEIAAAQTAMDEVCTR